MRTYLLKCDICGKSHEGTKTPDYWFEFLYEYSLGKDREITELEYLTCSIKCFYKQLEKSIFHSAEHCNVKIAGMTRLFAAELLKTLNPENVSVRVDRMFEVNMAKKDPPKNREEELEDEERIERTIKADTYFKPQPSPQFQSEKPKRKGKVIQIETEKHINIIRFAESNTDAVLVNRAEIKYEKDILTIYDGSLITDEKPTIPLIEYKNHYTIFIYESLQDEFDLILHSIKSELQKI